MTVHERWNAVLSELPAIGKERVNQQQGFKFRGVDDVLDQVKPLFGKHGVHAVPVAQTADREVRTTRNGGALHVVFITVDWRIWGVEGDYFDAQTIGEGTDSGDKATSKAQTMAFKYLLWPSLAVAEHDADADGTTPEETVPQSGSTAAGGATSRSSSPPSGQKSKVGLIVKIAKDNQISSPTLKKHVEEWIGHPNEDLNELTPDEETIVLAAIRSLEKELQNAVQSTFSGAGEEPF